jgi:hypothetical protein
LSLALITLRPVRSLVQQMRQPRADGKPARTSKAGSSAVSTTAMETKTDPMAVETVVIPADTVAMPADTTTSPRGAVSPKTVPHNPASHAPALRK